MSRGLALPRGAPRVRSGEDAYAERVALLTVRAAIRMMLPDGKIVNIARAEVRRGLGTSLSELRWVVDAYLLAFAVPPLAFGQLGDLPGLIAGPQREPADGLAWDGALGSRPLRRGLRAGG